MNKILIAVDGTKNSTAVVSTYYNLVKKPDSVILLHVEKLQGRSLMADMLGDAEMSTLKESLEGTEYKASLDEKANKILDYYRRNLEDSGSVNISTVVRAGRPCDEILKVAEEENVDLILIGNSARKGFNRFISGCSMRPGSPRATTSSGSSTRSPPSSRRASGRPGTTITIEAEDEAYHFSW